MALLLVTGVVEVLFIFNLCVRDYPEAEADPLRRRWDACVDGGIVSVLMTQKHRCSGESDNR